MTNSILNTNQLLDRAAMGDLAAREELLARHRARLHRMVVVRFDRRLAARVDPSDIVQETLADASLRMNEYLSERPIGYYPWLRRLALDRLDKAYRRHTAARRNVGREQPPGLPDESTLELVERLLAGNTDPAQAAWRKERKAQVRALLDQLLEADREVLVLRFLEQLSTNETAEVLGISPGAARSRLMRALQRLRSQLGDDSFLESGS